MGEIGGINSGHDIHTCTKPLPYFFITSICIKNFILCNMNRHGKIRSDQNKKLIFIKVSTKCYYYDHHITCTHTCLQCC